MILRLYKSMTDAKYVHPSFFIAIYNHEAIISPAVFDMVQVELQKRATGNTRYRGVRLFSHKIKCGDCGGWYGSKVWHSTDRYRKVIYRCNGKYEGEKCQTPHLTEEEAKAAFVTAYNQLVTEKEEIIANTEIVCRTLCDTTGLQEEKQRLEDEIEVLVEMTQNMVAENSCIAQDQNEYQERYDNLVQRYEEAKEKHDTVANTLSEKAAQSERLKEFIDRLKAQKGVIKEFDEGLWCALVDYMTVSKKKKITVTFRDGTKIKV